MLNVDMHGETLFRHNDAKGYFDLRLRPNNDCFYAVQLVASKFGSIQRTEEQRTRFDDKGNLLVPTEMNLGNDDKLYYASRIDKVVRKKNDLLFGLQFGKRFDRLIFRIGLFENTFGVACDFYVPLKTDKLHWVTSLEAFDFQGVNRLDDDRPHIKWVNKAFFMKNIYTSFGVDDIYSRRNASPFWGGGIRFGDDDLKYVASFLPLKKS